MINVSNNILIVRKWAIIMNNSILPEIKIIEYNEKYSKSTNDFVNLSMHIFIERPFKQREDLIDVKKIILQTVVIFGLLLMRII